jgi:hypothetical protein
MLRKLTTLKSTQRKIVSILIPAAFSWLFTAAGVFLFRDYGLAIFVFIPLFIGVASTVLFAYERPHTLPQIFGVAAWSVALYCGGLVIFAMEGLICILMAAPFGIAIAAIGTLIGEAIVKYKKGSALPSVIVLGLLIPILMSFESRDDDQPEIYTVTTSVIIDAPKEKVWEKVVAFSYIDEPKELLFKAGIAYPTYAEIVGTGVGAVRYCNFSTGRFVEPVTTWHQPDLLQFSVKEMPEPLKEISPYDIKPTHLHGYFVSTKGQFKLTALAGHKTLLEGTTWYYHKIAPAAYWQLWTHYILHKIHNRVLQHIKNDAGR